ncbi:MAG: hypothetical protein LC751_13805 [Actinobacteria bacterium]|nr:hypothetical protein [Actinomycetota bacterium]
MEPAEFSAAVGRTARRLGMDLSRPLAMVSGGPDSVALLRALVELRARPVVLHVALSGAWGFQPPGAGPARTVPDRRGDRR